MKFGENLYSLRKSAKMSQEKLAEKMEVSRQSVSKWENGESYPEMDKIMKLCDIFHCKINDLVHEDMTDIDSLDEEIKMSVVKFKEEKQKKIKGISKAIYVLARIGKIVATIGIPIIAMLIILTPILVNGVEVKNDTVIVNEEKAEDKMQITEEQTQDGVSLRFKVYNVVVAEETNPNTISEIKNVLENNSKTNIIIYLELGFVCLMACIVLYRMTLSRLEKLFININEGDTPFTLENVKYIKQMAKLMIVATIISACGDGVSSIILGENTNFGFEMFDIVQILFLFGISYIFEYGYELQLDSKGKMYGDENE